MIYICENCGGNVLFNPQKGKMVCPFCNGEETQEEILQKKRTECVSCGAELELKKFTSATQCPNCGTYVVLEDNIKDRLKPNFIIPFKINKQQATEKLKEQYSKKIFVPNNFLSNSQLDSIDGQYVPFWLYNFESDVSCDCIGFKIKKWVDGEYEFIKTSSFSVHRDLNINFSKVPVDASDFMEDKMMDLIEPYDYNVAEEFEGKYLSGFYAECYNRTKEELEPRAKRKAENYIKEYLDSTLEQYDKIESSNVKFDFKDKSQDFVLFPAWYYKYRYNGKDYEFYVNGQTGKLAGKPPISKKNIWAVFFSMSILLVPVLYTIISFIL